MLPLPPPWAVGRSRERRGLAGVGREGTSRGSELGKTERALRRAGGRRQGGQRPQPGERGRMEQVEILRKFIQRVQAMKSPDHNGEDNFARDFMVSPPAGCPSSRVHRSPPPSLARPAPAASALCAAVRRRAEGRAPTPRAGWSRRPTGGETASAPRPPFPSSRVRGTLRGRSGPKGSGHRAEPAFSTATGDHLLFLGPGSRGK